MDKPNASEMSKAAALVDSFYEKAREIDASPWLVLYVLRTMHLGAYEGALEVMAKTGKPIQ